MSTSATATSTTAATSTDAATTATSTIAATTATSTIAATTAAIAADAADAASPVSARCCKAEALKKYFSNPSNIDYILDKTKGRNQSIKIYEMMCTIKKTGGLDKAVDILKKDQLLWSNFTFQLEKRKIDEEDDFLTQPYEVSEGVLTCGACSSKKIFSYSKQTRSSDEPMTVFAQCSQCGNKWRE
jgi:DNA-directed RNA polymerase subunit M/transcription elongation factor TFIIS